MSQSFDFLQKQHIILGLTEISSVVLCTMTARQRGSGGADTRAYTFTHLDFCERLAVVRHEQGSSNPTQLSWSIAGINCMDNLAMHNLMQPKRIKAPPSICRLRRYAFFISRNEPKPVSFPRTQPNNMNSQGICCLTLSDTRHERKKIRVVT